MDRLGIFSGSNSGDIGLGCECFSDLPICILTARPVVKLINFQNCEYLNFENILKKKICGEAGNWISYDSSLKLMI